MRRHRNQNSDSLEMFLDTICNTFGGILFILLFVVLQLRTTQNGITASSASTVTPSEIASAEAKRDSLTARLESLRTNTELQQSIAGNISDPETITLFNTWQELLNLNNELQIDLADKTANITLLNKKLEIANQASALQAAIDKTRREIERNKEELANQKKEQSQNLSLPQLKETNKQGVSLVLRFGHLYLWHNYNSSGYRTSPNQEDFTYIKEDDIYIAYPKPWCGIDLTSSDPESEIDSLLRSFSNSRYMITLCVYPDSFPQYAFLRDYLKNRDYDICPFIMGSHLYVVDHSRGGSRLEAQ